MSSDRPAWHHHSHRGEDRYVVALRGELDMGVVDDLHELLTATIAQAPLIEVDLASVTFIDSTVISTLIRAHYNATAAGARLGVSNSTGPVHRVLDVTGVLLALQLAVNCWLEPALPRASPLMAGRRRRGWACRIRRQWSGSPVRRRSGREPLRRIRHRRVGDPATN